MNFELPLTKEQKVTIIKRISSFSNFRGLRSWPFYFLCLFHLTGEIFAGTVMIRLITAFWNIAITKVSEYGIMELIATIFIILGIKYLVFLFNIKIFNITNEEEMYFNTNGMKCVIINSANIKTDKKTGRNRYVGRKWGAGGFMLNRTFSFELDDKTVFSDDENCLVIGATTRRILDGNREHLGVIYGKNNIILIAASLIDERYAKLTFDELKGLADMEQNKSIDAIDIDDYIKNSKFRTSLRDGRKLDNSDKTSYAIKIFMQFYRDNKSESIFMELIKRGIGFISDVLCEYGFIGILLLRGGYRLLLELFGCFTGGIELVKPVIIILFVIPVIIEIYYNFIRNDISRQILKSKECIELYGRLHFADEVVDSGSISDNYILETDSGFTLSGIHEREDLYIYPDIVDERVIILASDNMIAIYPEGYFV